MNDTTTPAPGAELHESAKLADEAKRWLHAVTSEDKRHLRAINAAFVEYAIDRLAATLQAENARLVRERDDLRIEVVEADKLIATLKASMPDIEATSRAEFEAEMLPRWPTMNNPPRIISDGAPNAGQYAHFNWQECWEIWQAARRTSADDAGNHGPETANFEGVLTPLRPVEGVDQVSAKLPPGWKIERDLCVDDSTCLTIREPGGFGHAIYETEPSTRILYGLLDQIDRVGAASTIAQEAP